jgi:hypothetical protein
MNVDCEVTCEQLAALTAGDLAELEAERIGAHAADCELCRRRLGDLARADAALAGARADRPSARAVLSAQRTYAEVTRPAGPAEIMTLAEAARFLRVTAEQLGEVLEELPAFELAGQIRLRRARLIEWIEQRECDHSRRSAGAWAARYAADPFGKGVA